jgi:hypothetical protein
MISLLLCAKSGRLVKFENNIIKNDLETQGVAVMR